MKVVTLLLTVSTAVLAMPTSAELLTYNTSGINDVAAAHLQGVSFGRVLKKPTGPPDQMMMPAGMTSLNGTKGKVQGGTHFVVTSGPSLRKAAGHLVCFLQGGLPPSKRDAAIRGILSCSHQHLTLQAKKNAPQSGACQAFPPAGCRRVRGLPGLRNTASIVFVAESPPRRHWGERHRPTPPSTAGGVRCGQNCRPGGGGPKGRVARNWRLPHCWVCLSAFPRKLCWS